MPLNRSRKARLAGMREDRRMGRNYERCVGGGVIIEIWVRRLEGDGMHRNT
jgi:hypothetical protein